MNKIKTVIVDDDPNIIKQFSELLSFYNYIDLIGDCDNFLKLKKLINLYQVDLIFLDIKLDRENGIDIGKYISESFKNIYIIFITSQPEFALDGYQANPFGFLTKPVNTLHLERTLDRLKQKILKNKLYENPDIKISIQSKNKLELIEISKIKMIQKQLRKVNILTFDNQSIRSHETIKDLSGKLKKFGFIAINRSTIIPLNIMSSFEYDSKSRSYTLFLKGGGSINKISLDRFKEIKQTLSEFNWII